MKCCGTCHWLDVKPDADGKRRVRKLYAYPCLAPVPDFEKMLPDSITTSMSWRSNPGKRYMQKTDGQNCPVYKAMEAG